MKIMGLDYGDARTGLAICDAGEMLASPVGVIHSHRMDEVVQKAAEAAREQRAERIVVGNPINMNGTRGPRSELCQEFAAKLGEASGLPVVLWDERSTTVTAISYLNATDTRVIATGFDEEQREARILSTPAAEAEKKPALQPLDEVQGERAQDEMDKSFDEILRIFNKDKF